MILAYVHESDVAAYHAQGWLCWRLMGLHGARRYAARTFLAVLEWL